jgi:hypothetical protein
MTLCMIAEKKCLHFLRVHIRRDILPSSNVASRNALFHHRRISFFCSLIFQLHFWFSLSVLLVLLKLFGNHVPQHHLVRHPHPHSHPPHIHRPAIPLPPHSPIRRTQSPSTKRHADRLLRSAMRQFREQRFKRDTPKTPPHSSPPSRHALFSARSAWQMHQ